MAHEVRVHPTAGLIVTVAVVTVAQSMFSDQLTVTALFGAIPVAPFAGMVLVTVGATVSTITVLGVANTADTFPIASFTHGYSV